MGRGRQGAVQRSLPEEKAAPQLLRLRKPGREKSGKGCPVGAQPPPHSPSGPGGGRSRITTKAAGGRACCAAAFREGGGSGEGSAVGRWLKVPGKGFRRHSSPRLPKLGSSLSPTTGEVGSPSARERDSAATGAERSPQWRAGPSQAVRIPSAK